MHDDDEGFYTLPPPALERPTLLNSCARAATSAEAAFRVQYPNALRRSSRVIALDRGAAKMMHAISEDPWKGAHFLMLSPVQAGLSKGIVALAEQDGSVVDFNADIVGADVIVMIATTDEGAAAAGVIGAMAWARGVMTAGIVMAGARDGDIVMGAMRQCTAVLVRAGDEDYLPAMLSALRA